MLLYGNLVLLYESLLQEAVLLVVLADAAHNHLLDDLLRLRLSSGLVFLGSLDEQDFLLLVQSSLIYVRLVHEQRAHSSCLHADVLAQLDNCRIALQVVGNFQTNQNADNAAHMGVANVYGALVVTLEAADLQIFADGQNLLLQSAFNGYVAHFSSLQSVQICRILSDNNLCYVRSELLEVSVLCNEVGLRVYFYDCSSAALVADLDAYDALSSNAASLLSSLCQTLLTQDLNCLVEVTVSFGQCLLAIHHTNIGLLAQCLYILCRKCHGVNSS